MPTAVTNLRVEHLDDAFGIHVTEPRLSWRLPAGADRLPDPDEQRGRKAVGVIVADGWYRGLIGYFRSPTSGATGWRCWRSCTSSTPTAPRPCSAPARKGGAREDMSWPRT